MAMWSLCAASLGVQSAALEAETANPLREPNDYVEEVIVTAELFELEKGAIPSQMAIVQTYSTLRRGKRLYKARRYEEALPYLLVAAKRGFKWAQAMAGDIYLHGRDGVPRDVVSGLGWLGVAARPQTASSIRNYYRQAMAGIPTNIRPHMEDVVARFREQWSSRHWRVSCSRAVAGSPIATGVMSLRLKRMSCVFADEVPVCREPLYDVGDVFEPGNPPFQWVCPPVTGG